MFNFGLTVSDIQRAASRGFLHEHPSPAQSWQLPQLQNRMARFNYETTTFDQCRYGLESPKGYP